MLATSTASATLAVRDLAVTRTPWSASEAFDGPVELALAGATYTL
jgi:hypothetical protein